MLATILESQSSQINTLALAWLAQGATSFALWENDQRLACWPSNANPTEPSLSAKVQVSLRPIGELRVTGMNSAANQQRLEADAQLIASMLLLQSDLDAVVAEAVDQQDQLLAFYNLSQATRDCWIASKS